MMVTKKIKGVVRGGKVEPAETLDAAEGTEVTINVPVGPKLGEGQMMTFGMFAGPPFTTEEDFREAKSLWEREWERSWERLERE